MALMPVDEARALILASAAPLAEETVSISEAEGRVLAHDFSPAAVSRWRTCRPWTAMRCAPPILRLWPADLDVIGESAAGRPFAGPLGPGMAARIFTGALVPDGADTVVIQENTTRGGQRVRVVHPTEPGRNIRKAGFDFASGAVLCPPGAGSMPAR